MSLKLRPDSKVRVLLVDDDEDDYVVTRDLVASIPGRPIALDWVSDYDAALAAAARNEHQVYLIDYRLGARTGIELLFELRERGCDRPVILLTGQSEFEIDLEAAAAGAADYLEKGRLDEVVLERSIRYAIKQHAQEAELERKVRERTAELAESVAKLREADRRKDEFLATLAHELRNPLAPIRNALHLMGREPGEGPGRESDRAMAERQVAHMARLVDDLMDVSRIARGKVELRRGVVDLAGVARHALDVARPLAEGRGHALEARLPGGPLLLEGDAARLEQVLVNLLVNAAKYTDPGGRILLGVAREGGEAVVRVADTGIGIEPGMQREVFGRFVQAERRLDRSRGGLGLGLSLARSLVEMHGGSVEARSEGPGRGSEFVVRLPAPEALETAERQPAGAALARSMPSRRPTRRGGGPGKRPASAQAGHLGWAPSGRR